MKKQKKHWYFITIYECVLCGHRDEYRERRYTPRPKDYMDRHKFYDMACWDHFM